MLEEDIAVLEPRHGVRKGPEIVRYYRGERREDTQRARAQPCPAAKQDERRSA